MVIPSQIPMIDSIKAFHSDKTGGKKDLVGHEDNDEDDDGVVVTRESRGQAVAALTPILILGENPVEGISASKPQGKKFL